MPRIALSIAGSDPSGGAGIQADLATFAHHGVHGAAVLTALTAQNTRGVFGVHAVPSPFVADQLRAVLEDLDVGAVKVGMLGAAAVVESVAATLASLDAVPVVLDPVMVAAGGEPLLDADAAGVLRALCDRATLLTPNVHEAALLLDAPRAESVEAMVEQARALRKLGPSAVLLKGGRRGVGSSVVDVFLEGDGEPCLLEHPRLGTGRVHGGGCTISSAIAARLARGDSMDAAVRGARDYVQAALARGLEDPVGGGATALVHPLRD